MLALRVLFAIFAAGLAALISWAIGADQRGLGPVLEAMLRDPWTLVTLVDLYLGFFIAAAIILAAEKRLLVGLFFALPIFILGNVWTALWIALRLPALVRRLRAGS